MDADSAPRDHRRRAGWHPIQPPGHAVLWRYMDFTRFLSMLDKGALFFARVDKLGDPFEGALPRANIEVMWPKWYGEGQIGWAATRRMFTHFHRENRKFVVVNCWHEGDHETGRAASGVPDTVREASSSSARYAAKVASSKPLPTRPLRGQRGHPPPHRRGQDLDPRPLRRLPGGPPPPEGSSGAGQTRRPPPREPGPGDVVVPCLLRVADVVLSTEITPQPHTSAITRALGYPRSR